MNLKASARSTVRRGALTIDPAKNPAVLDTCTWDPRAAVAVLTQSPVEPLDELRRAIRDGQPPPTISAIAPFMGSIAHKGRARSCLASFPMASTSFSSFTRVISRVNSLVCSSTPD